MTPVLGLAAAFASVFASTDGRIAADVIEEPRTICSGEIAGGFLVSRATELASPRPFASTLTWAQSQRAKLLAEYRARLAKVDRKNAEQLAEIATWCASKGLKTYATLNFRKAIKIDPQNEVARRGLGHVRVEGKWCTPEEAAKMRAAKAAAAREAEAAKTREAAASKGTPLMPPNEARSTAAVDKALSESKNLEFAKKLSGDWSKAITAPTGAYNGVRSARFDIVAKATPAECVTLARIGEWVRRRLDWITYEKLDTNRFKRGKGRLSLFLGDTTIAKTGIAFLDKRYPQLGRWTKLEDIERDLVKGTLEFFTWYEPPLHLHQQMVNQRSAVANVTARSWLEQGVKPAWDEPRLGRSEAKPFCMMNWMLEGVGIWYSLAAVGQNRLWRISDPLYANETKEDKRVNVDYVAIAYEAATKRSYDGKSTRSFPQLCRARLNSFGVVDLALSFSLVDWLLRERLEDWRGLCAKLAKHSTFREAFVAQFGNAKEQEAARAARKNRKDRALDEVFGAVADRIDGEWRTWVSREYAPNSRSKIDAIKAAAPFKRPDTAKKR